MARSDSFTLGRKLAIDDVQIRSTNAARLDLRLYLTRLGAGFFDLGNSKGVTENILRRSQNCSSHEEPFSAWL
jgi:hypothetical protein